VQFTTALVAVVALIVSLTTVNDRVTQIQQSRYKAAVASCRLLWRAVTIASNGRPDTRARVATFLARTGLVDCQEYARGVIRR